MSAIAARATPRRYWRRNITRDSLKLEFDLNSPPPPPPPALSAPVRIDVEVEEGMTSSVVLLEVNGGDAAVTPIEVDVEEIDADEIQMLGSSGLAERRNERKRRNQAALVIDVEQANNSNRTGRVQNLNRRQKGPRIEPDNVIDCESYSAKEAKRPEPVPEPPKMVMKHDCPICLNTLSDPCSTLCGHIFCEGCLKQALQVKKSCPTCRAKLTAKKCFHKVFLPVISTVRAD